MKTLRMKMKTTTHRVLTGKFENCAPEIRPRFAKFTSKYIRASKLRARYLGRAIQTFQTGTEWNRSRALWPHALPIELTSG